MIRWEFGLEGKAQVEKIKEDKIKIEYINPELWKHPYAVPIYKSGDIEDVGNYPPISILSVLSKILEKIVATQLMKFLEDHNLLANSQHGFRSGLSTETALMKVNEYVYDNIDKQKLYLLLLLDLSKAFDSVCHDNLLLKGVVRLERT